MYRLDTVPGRNDNLFASDNENVHLLNGAFIEFLPAIASPEVMSIISAQPSLRRECLHQPGFFVPG
jgi:hypothetical protein